MTRKSSNAPSRTKDAGLVGVLHFHDSTTTEIKTINVYLGSQLNENYLQHGLVPDAVISLPTAEQAKTTTDRFLVYVCTSVVEEDHDGERIIMAEYQRQEITAVVQF